MTFCDWIPRTTAAAVWPARNGSSLMYSQLRPLSGTRSVSMPGASCTLTPLANAWAPSAAPKVCCAVGSQLADCAIGAGNAVVPVMKSPTPWPASLSTRSGMQRLVSGEGM